MRRIRLINPTSVAPVEVARLRPEPLLLRRVLLGRPRVRHRGFVYRDGRLLTVHRLLDTGLLLGLEQRMVLERVLALVLLERLFMFELGVSLLQLEMVLDHL